MFGRRLRALIVAALAIGGLAWCVRQLQTLGAPFLPGFLAGIVPPDLRDVAARLAAEGAALATQIGNLVVVVLQIAVAALAMVALLALLMAIRRPRQARPGTVTTIRATPRPVERATETALPERCPACGRPVHADWVACPACTTRLPVRQVS